MKILFIFFVSLFSSLSFSAENDTIDTPSLWEIGLAGAGGVLPDYPSANETHFHFLPVPIFHYRGKIFKVDEKDGARARLINYEHFNLDISAAGSFASDNNNKTRRGMPKLDYSAELGPRVVFFAFDKPTFGRLGFNVPVREVIALNYSGPYTIGAVIEPTLFFDRYHWPCEFCTLTFRETADFVDQGVANYYYRVDPTYVASERSAYDAKSGYLGADSSVELAYRRRAYAFYLYLDYSYYGGSANLDSPLFKSFNNLTLLLGFNWFFLFSSSTEEKTLPKLEL